MVTNISPKKGNRNRTKQKEIEFTNYRYVIAVEVSYTICTFLKSSYCMYINFMLVHAIPMEYCINRKEVASTVSARKRGDDLYRVPTGGCISSERKVNIGVNINVIINNFIQENELITKPSGGQG